MKIRHQFYLLVIAMVFVSLLGTRLELVVKAIDGDTLELESGERIRLIGIDTPEKGEYYYEEALERLAELTEERYVELEKGKQDRDKYGRQLRYVFSDGVFVNLVLVEEGYARAFPFDPGQKYETVIAEAEERAISQNLGIWARPDAITYEEQLAMDPCELLGCPPGTRYAASSKSDKMHDCSSRWAKRISKKNLICFETALEAAHEGYAPS